MLILSGCGGGGGGSDGGGSQTNFAPSIVGVSTDYVRAGSNYDFTPTATDLDNDPLNYTIENKPDWAQFDPNTGELSGKPTDQDIKHYNDIIIKVSDGTHTTALKPFSLDVMYPEVNKNNIQIGAGSQVTNTTNGYDVVGDAAIQVGNLVTDLKNANLQFEYDADGNLLDLAGDTDVPPVISNTLSLDTSVHAVVGMYTGAEINARADIGPNSEPGILLRDEFRYLVYFLNAGVDMTFHGLTGDVPISLGLAGTTTLIITDPTDPFFYYYGQIAGLAAGYGKSFNGNIPYKPLFEQNGPLAFAPLEPFYGTDILKGTFPISAFKVFDVLELNGTAVCSPPQLLDCDKPTPTGMVVSLAQALLTTGIDPTQQFKVGINGSAGVTFRVLGIDLFKYHLLDMASMIDIGTDREHIAIQGVVDSQHSESPTWLPIKPIPDVGVTMIGNLYGDVATQTGDGDFGISLYGEFPSSFPAATIKGTIDINPKGLQMVGTVPDPDNPIVVRATVDGTVLTAGIEFGYDFQKNVDSVVNGGVNRALDKVDQAYNDLQNAVGDYDLSFSLHGLRSQIPTIVDTTIANLNPIPQQVYNKVYTETLNGIDSASYTYTISDPCKITGGSCPIKTTLHAKDFVNETSIATTAATNAKSKAQGIIDTRIAELNDLKTQAQTATDPQFQQALKTALETVAAHDTVDVAVKVSQSVSFKYGGVTVHTGTYTFYNNTLTYTVIDSTTKANLQTAAVYAGEIGPDYQIKLNTQQIFDALPTKDQINQVAKDVQDGAVQVPVVKGGGYTVKRTGEQSAYVLLGNDKIDIAFNPLDPKAAIDGVGDLIVTYLTK